MTLKHIIVLIGLLLAGGVPAPLQAVEFETRAAASRDAAPFLQCVPYARKLTGINIYGDAHTWWKQAEGRYARGFLPKAGAVMAIAPHANSRLGHVAAVSRIVDSRTILISHSNWSPINGRRGQIEDNVPAVDVSSANDWSRVRIWFAPSKALGGTHWPVTGFIYLSAPPRAQHRPMQPPPQRRPHRRDPIGDIIGQRMGW